MHPSCYQAAMQTAADKIIFFIELQDQLIPCWLEPLPLYCHTFIFQEAHANAEMIFSCYTTFAIQSIKI